MAEIHFVYVDDEGLEHSASLPARWEICFRCHGDNSVDAWEGGMTGEEMAEQGPEFFEDYMAGVYSVSCPECEYGKVRVPDASRADEALLAAWEREQQAEAEYAAEVAAERRMLGG